MNIEKQIADQVRELPDKQLADMALKLGFSLKLSKPNGESKGARKPSAPRKPKPTPAVEGLGVTETELVLAKVQQAAQKKLGVSTAELVEQMKLPKSHVVRAIKKLIEDGQVFKGGDKRFTRYADTQTLADDAAIACKGG